MKIDISTKVPFSGLKPGARGMVDCRPFLRIDTLLDPSVSCGAVVSAVSLEDGRPLSISGDTLVDVEAVPAEPTREPRPGEVWTDADGDYLLRAYATDGGAWVDLATGAYLPHNVDVIRPVDVKLVRA